MYAKQPLTATVLAMVLVIVGGLPVLSQTIDTIPSMPPVPGCGPSTTSTAPSPSSTSAVQPTPSATTSAQIVGVIPPRRATTPATLPRWNGSWDETWDHVAIAPRTRAAVGTLPGEPFGTVLWGGVGADGQLLNDGVMIDDSGATRVLPAAPICPRRDFAWSIDGSGDVRIWGGVDQQGNPLADGAWYSLSYGTWGLLPPSPLPAGPAIASGHFVVATDPATGLAQLSAVDDLEETPRWTAPVEVPLPVGDRYDVICCGQGSLTVFSLQPGGFALAARMLLEYPHEGDWIQLGQVPLPFAVGGGPASGRATERDLTAWVRSTDQPYPGTDLTGDYGLLMRMDRPDQSWQLTAPAPEAVVDDPSLVLSPTHLISVQGMVAYDVIAGRWVRLPKRGNGSARFGPPDGATAWWNDGRLWVFGGRTPDGSMESRLWTFTPELPTNQRRLPTRLDLDGYGEGCVAFGTDGIWRLRGSLDDPLIVWTQSGQKRQDTHWPEGWVARFDPKLEILDTRGRVRYRDGDVCRLDVGSGG